MKILVACEFSGIVRDAFIAKGHDAISCDLLPTERPGPHHQGDVRDILYDGWDMLIAFPECTYLTNAGIRWFNEDRYGDKARERKKKRIEAQQFVETLWGSDIEKVVIENPVGWLNSHWRKPDQIIHPYYFGDPESKRTCLWLRKLPKLVHTNVVVPKVYGYFKNGPKKGHPIYGTQYCKFSPDRGKIRSKFWPGIADAMAEQWG